MGGYLIFYATNWGPWAFSDSAAYLSAARNLQAGDGAIIHNSNGSITPVTEFPPLYPFLLSLCTPLKGNFISSARWLNIIFFTFSIFIIGFLGQKVFNNYLTGILSSLFFAVSPLMLDTFSSFMSEPLFISLLLLLVFLLIEFINSKKNLFLLAIIVFSAFLPMVRYAGILFILCVGLCLFVYRNEISQKKIYFVPLYFLISLAPVGLWFLNQYQELNKIGGKRFSFSLIFLENIYRSILQEIKIFSGWVPYSGIYALNLLNFAIIFLFSSLLIIALVVGLRASRNKLDYGNNKSLLLFNISLFFLCAYMLFIGITHSLTIPKIDIIDRMMAPVFPFLIFIILGAYEISIIKTKSWLIKSGFILIAMISIRFYGMTSLKSAEMLHNDGLGLTSRLYQESDFLPKLESLPANQSMISNSAAFVLFHTNRFPLQVDQFHDRAYGSGDAYGEKSFREKHAALIILFPEFRNYYGDNSDQLLQSLTTGLRVDYMDETGGIFYYPE